MDRLRLVHEIDWRRTIVLTVQDLHQPAVGDRRSDLVGHQTRDAEAGCCCLHHGVGRVDRKAWLDRQRALVGANAERPAHIGLQAFEGDAVMITQSLEVFGLAAADEVVRAGDEYPAHMPDLTADQLAVGHAADADRDVDMRVDDVDDVVRQDQPHADRRIGGEERMDERRDMKLAELVRRRHQQLAARFAILAARRSPLTRVQISPRGNANDPDVLRGFARAVLAAAPAASGAAINYYESSRIVTGAFAETGTLALLAIAALLYIALRRIGDVLLTLIPLLVAGLLALEIVVIWGLPTNFANIVALPLLLGVGVAFKIYYIMAWRAGNTHLLQSALAQAVVFSALTNAVAFGSMWASEYPGMSSMGKLMALSLLCTMMAAVLF